MKKIIVLSFVFGLFLTLVMPVSAQTPTSSLLQKNARATTTRPNLPAGGTTQTRSVTEIDRRIAALNNALTTLNAIKFLSSTEKTAIAQKVQNEINMLTALKQKIAANTDPLTLKSDAASVSASHKTFAFVFPQIRVLAAADALNSAANMLFDFAERLEARIMAAKAAGNNTSALESQLAQMKAQITAAQTLTTSIMSTASTTPTDPAAGRTALVTASKNIKQAAKSLRSALQTGNQIKAALIKMAPETATPSATMPSTSSANPLRY